MFADASALVAIIADEPERALFRDKMAKAVIVLVSPLVLYEASLAAMRIGLSTHAAAAALVEHLLDSAAASVVPIDHAVGKIALEAFAKYGKGRHQAGLNMGDCFAYACAKAHKVPLLYKRGDFALTDIESA